MGKIQDIRAAIRDCFDANKTSLTKAQIVIWVGENRPHVDANSGTFSTQLYRSCANVNHIQKTTAPQILWYEKQTRTYRLRLAADAIPDHTSTAGDQRADDSDFRPDPRFVLEAHLRDYLARNLGILEIGLKLWSDNPPSVEFDVSGRRIDILAKDADGNPVVIELKLSRGHEKTIGQALYYRGKLREQLKTPKVRIIMVAGEITEELRLASGEVGDVTLYEYAISMSVKKVG